MGFLRPSSLVRELHIINLTKKNMTLNDLFKQVLEYFISSWDSTISAFNAKMKGTYEATPTTLADGESGDIGLNANHAVKTDMDTQIAGERNPDSENNYIVVSGEWNITVVDLETDADIVVSSVPSLLKKVYVNVVMSAHDVIIKNDTIEKLRIPASSAVGTEKDFDGAKFSTNITIESDDAATGKIAVLWRAI